MYKLSLRTAEVTRLSDNKIVAPTGIENDPDYLEFDAWVALGNEPELIYDQDEVIEAPIIIVTPRQIRLALTAAGLREAVEGAVAAGSQDLKDTWEFSTEIQRDNPLLVQMGTALGKTSEDLDNLFKLAASL